MGKDSYSDIMQSGGPPKRRSGMDIGHRAKQFAPFDALRGFSKGLRAAEEKAVSDAAEELCMKEPELSYGEENSC